MSDNFDDYMIIDKIIVKRSDCSIAGCYRDGIEIDKKDMTQEELLRAHDIVRKHTFDIVGEENKSG